MRYLLDTNVFREIQKGPTGHKNVRAWLDGVDDADIRLSVMTVMEVRRGIVRLAKGKAGAAQALAERFEAVLDIYGRQVVSVDRPVADEWGRLQGEKDKHRDDLAFAATARVHDFVLVTRNVKDFRGRDVRVLDPFKAKPVVVRV